MILYDLYLLLGWGIVNVWYVVESGFCGVLCRVVGVKGLLGVGVWYDIDIIWCV